MLEIRENGGACVRIKGIKYMKSEIMMSEVKDK
jgi:hypothetical protein